ncbi:TMEM165/GDT1 family protein [Sphingomonas sp. SCN 67-18]|uniref:TMEM165/GDT1 family protein n=1 Tax=uncultured Sphingomonas sp. TaxID=158754 RepID=UPI0025DB9DB1|nr:TMEM165/GDT1 family protein [Sphingomonas sp. SCN 67-18]
MDAFLTSTLVVALAEIGDKTQLLAIVLAARFKRPVPIVLGILFATIANHFLAALVGSEVASLLDGQWFRYLVAASFIVMAGWTLIPDTFDEAEDARPSRHASAFVATLIAFFLVEMGDKTQIATVALGARFHDVVAVTAGTTIGMMIANVPAVLLGGALIRVVPMKAVRTVAALLFLVIGLWVLADTAGWLGGQAASSPSTHAGTSAVAGPMRLSWK